MAQRTSSSTSLNSLFNGNSMIPRSIDELPKKISLLSMLPAFKDVLPEYHPLLFVCKLRQCCRHVRPDEVELRKQKHTALYFCLEYINSLQNVFPEVSIPDFFACVTFNLFRTTPKPPCDEYTWDSDLDTRIDPSWNHLQFVYELLLRFVFAINAPEVTPEYQQAARKYIDSAFVIRLLQLFSCIDPRERDYVKTIIHRIYANFMNLRFFIRNVLKSEVAYFMISHQQHNGVNEILEILGSVINGFATPLKPEHISFLVQVLIPLHRVMNLSSFFGNLNYCATRFVTKDPSLSAGVVMGILNYWPRLSNVKEASFVSGLRELLIIIEPVNLMTSEISIRAKLRALAATTTNGSSQDASAVRTYAPALPTFPIPKMDITLFGLPPSFLNDLKTLDVYKAIFYYVSQCICSSHYSVAESAIALLTVEPKFNDHLHIADEMFWKLISQHGIQVTPTNCIYLYDYHFPYTLCKALHFNRLNHWNNEIRKYSALTLQTLLTEYSINIETLEDMYFLELIAYERLRADRQAKWDRIACLCDKNLGGDGTLSDEYRRRAFFIDQRDGIGENVDEDVETLSFNEFSFRPDENAVVDVDANVEFDHPIKEMSLNPNLVAFDPHRTSFVPGYKQEVVEKGRVALALVPADPVNRLMSCGLKSYGLTATRVRRLVTAVDNEISRLGSDDFSIKELAVRQGLVTVGETGRQPNGQLADGAGQRRAPSARGKGGETHTVNAKLRRRSVIPMSMEVKVARQELNEYVSPGDRVGKETPSEGN